MSAARPAAKSAAAAQAQALGDSTQLSLVGDLPIFVGPPAPLARAPKGTATKIVIPMPDGVPEYWGDACRQLMRRDRVLKRLIPQLASAPLPPPGDAFATLARSIVSQQIAAKSAKTLWNKFLRLPSAMQPELVLKLKVDDMRATGLSARKIDYLVDLALHFTENRLATAQWSEMSNEAVIADLMAIRGVSRWTAEIFLIRHLMRPNVLPLDDAALISGISQNYFSGDPVSRSDAREVADAWKPWCSVATWYIWRSLEAQSAAG